MQQTLLFINDRILKTIFVQGMPISEWLFLKQGYALHQVVLRLWRKHYVLKRFILQK